MPAKGSARRKSASKRSKVVSGSVRAGTLFPVGRMNRLLKQGRFSARQSSSSGCFMAGVLEYLTAEILELAGNVCEQQKKKTISPKHLNLGVRSDDELSKLMAEVTVAQGGMLPNIPEFFLKKKKGGKAMMGSQPV